MKRRAPGEGARAVDAGDYSATLDASFFTERPLHRSRVRAGIQPSPLSRAQKRALRRCLALLRRAAKIGASTAQEYGSIIRRYVVTFTMTAREIALRSPRRQRFRYLCIECFATEAVRRARTTDFVDGQAELMFGKLRRWSDDSFAWFLAIDLAQDGVRLCLDAESCSFCDAAIRG